MKAPARHPSPVDSTPNTAPRRPQPVLLVVDDDTAVLGSFAKLFEDHFAVLTTDSGENALGLIATRHVDVVLLDLLMPGLDGLETLRRIKERDRRLPVVILTGLDRAQSTATAMRLGAFDCVSKPCPSSELLLTIESALDQRGIPSAVAAHQPAVPAILVGADLGVLATLKFLLGRYVVVNIASSVGQALDLIADSSPALVAIDIRSSSLSWQGTLRMMLAQLRGCSVIVGVNEKRGDVRDVPSLRDIEAISAGACVVRYGRVEEFADHIGWTLLRRAVRPSSLYRPYVLAALDYVAHQYPQSLRLRGVAAAARVSPRQLESAFRADTGQSVMEYVKSLRVEIAKCLLAEGVSQLEDAAQRLGFSDSSHLSRVFLERVGVRPGEYYRRLATARLNSLREGTGC